HVGRTARQAIDAARTGRAFRQRSTIGKKAADLLGTDYRWALAVDGAKSLLEPGAHSVLVDLEQARDLFNRITAVDFGEPRIWVARPHGLTGVRDGQRLEKPRIGVRRVARRAGLEPLL